jgi:hypothetical protein
MNMMFYFMSEYVDMNVILGLPIPIALLAWSSARLGIVWDAARIFGALSLLFSVRTRAIP